MKGQMGRSRHGRGGHVWREHESHMCIMVGAHLRESDRLGLAAEMTVSKAQSPSQISAQLPC